MTTENQDQNQDQDQNQNQDQDQNQNQDQRPQDVPLPEPSLLTLITGLASQAMVSMGMFPDPSGGQSEIKLHQAKHLIETIALLETKTEGNRTAEESSKLANLLHELRIIFIAAQKEQEKRKNK
ncbi:MAG: DUF1844 domain-containing protein [Planctomycetaceae bacterium]|jgi:hypothetical protein|nr:DUF1844 domain-containing protein [Planctomycetaceae bacterium]